MAGAVFSHFLKEIQFLVQVRVLEGSRDGFGNAFGRLFGTLWDTLGDLGGHFGLPWSHLGPPWPAMGCSGMSLGDHFARLGRLFHIFCLKFEPGCENTRFPTHFSRMSEDAFCFLWGEAAEGRPSLLESWGKL